MSKFILFLISLLSIHGVVYADIDSLFNKLDEVLIKKADYTNNKLSRIADLKLKLKTANQDSTIFTSYLKIFEEYKGINFDSALTYANILQEEALRLNAPEKIEESKINLAFILLSAGMFKETQ